MKIEDLSIQEQNDIAKEILFAYKNNLEYEINQLTDAAFLSFCIAMRLPTEDCIELKGYRKGLNVAKEILERVYYCTLEDHGIFEDEDSE